MNFALKAGAKVIKLYSNPNVSCKKIQLKKQPLLQHTDVQYQYRTNQDLMLR